MQLIIGLFIGLAVGLTGIGGGSFTVPALVLIVGLPAGGAVGTAFVFADILFGLVLAVIGSVFHWSFGSIDFVVLGRLLAGGIPGVLAGCLLARKIPARRVKYAIALIAIFAGLQLIWAGTDAIIKQRNRK